MREKYQDKNLRAKQTESSTTGLLLREDDRTVN